MNRFLERFLVGMKIPARDRIFHKGGIINMKEALDYVFTLPVSTVIVGVDKIAEFGEAIRVECIILFVA